MPEKEPEREGGTGSCRAEAALRGRRVLIVEDDYFIASDLARGFEKAGIEIVGPVPSLAEALALIERGRIDGAVLDIKLSEHMVYPVADALIGRSIPFIFVTGYAASVIPVRFETVAHCYKPFNVADVIAALGRA